MEQALAQIFLASQRLEEKSKGYRSLCTVLNRNKSELQIKECVLQAGETYACNLRDNYTCFVLPMSGNLLVTTKEKTIELYVETAGVFNQSLALQNMYSYSPVHFLQIILAGDFQCDHIDLGILSHRNQLHHIFETHEKLSAHIGKYDGRVDGSLKVTPSSEVFVYVVGGIFEVQNRLLHERDGLWVSGITELEFEGLVEEGIVLVMCM